MQSNKYLLFLVLVAQVFTNSALCQSSPNKEKKQYRITKQSKETIPEPRGFINDFENLYSACEAKSLDSLVSAFAKETTIEIVVVTIDTAMTSIDSLDNFTLRIGNAWGVGDKEKNNGIVIGISSGHRKMRIQNGYEIEEMLSDKETQIIVDNKFIPPFNEGDYYTGTLNGIQDIIETLKKKISGK